MNGFAHNIHVSEIQLTTNRPFPSSVLFADLKKFVDNIDLKKLMKHIIFHKQEKIQQTTHILGIWIGNQLSNSKVSWINWFVLFSGCMFLIEW